MPRWRSSRPNQIRARRLRAALTPSEQRLWENLRKGQLGEFEFRRQYPMGPFIVDFYCPQARLIVEVDGDVHCERPDYDRRRSEWLQKEKCCRIIRFTNDQILDSLDEVLLQVWEALTRAEEEPPP